MKRKLLLTLVAFSVALGTQAQTVDEILAKYLANTGGVEKLKAQKTRKSEGKVGIPGLGDVPITLYQKVPIKSKTVMQINGVELVQAYDGTDAWQINPFQGGKDPVKMTEEESKDLTDRDFEDNYIDYKTKGHEVTLLGTEEVEGTKCFKVQLIKNKNNPKEDVTEIDYFDAENFVPIMQVSYIRTGPSKGQEIKTYLSDYQDVKGFMVPFFIEGKMNGQTIQKITFSKVTFDEPIDDSIFTFPKK